MSNPHQCKVDSGRVLLVLVQDTCIESYLVQLSFHTNTVAILLYQCLTWIMYPGMKEEVNTALMRSSLESNWSTSKPLGLQRI